METYQVKTAFGIRRFAEMIARGILEDTARSESLPYHRRYTGEPQTPPTGDEKPKKVDQYSGQDCIVGVFEVTEARAFLRRVPDSQLVRIKTKRGENLYELAAPQGILRDLFERSIVTDALRYIDEQDLSNVVRDVPNFGQSPFAFDPRRE